MTAWLVLLPGVGDDRQARALVDPGRIRRRQVVRDDDPPLDQAAEGVLRLAEEVLEDPLGHVADVAGALAQVLVVDLGEGLDVLLRDHVEAGLDVPAGRLEFADRLGDQRLVLEDEQVGVKDQGLVFPQALLDLVLDLRDLLAGDQERLSKRAISSRRLSGST